MKKSKIFIYFFLFVFLLGCRDNLIDIDRNAYKNALTSDNLDFSTRLKFIKAELESSIEIEGIWYRDQNDRPFKPLLVKLEEEYFINYFLEKLENYTGDQRYIKTPLAAYISYHNPFSYFKSLKDDTELNIFEDQSNSIELTDVKNLFLNFIDQKYFDLKEGLRNHHKHLFDFIEKNKEKGVDFFRFCIEPYKEFFGDQIKVFELLTVSDSWEKAAEEELEQFKKKYTLQEEGSSMGVLSGLKIDQIKGILEDRLIKDICLKILEGNYASRMITRYDPEAGREIIIREHKNPKERESDMEEYRRKLALLERAKQRAKSEK